MCLLHCCLCRLNAKSRLITSNEDTVHLVVIVLLFSEGLLSQRNSQPVEYHSGKPLYPCTLCPVKCRIPSVLKRHMQVHRTYTCGVCSQQFEDVQSLNAHKRNHAKDKDYACTECGTKFRQPYELRRHMLIHTGQLLHFYCCV